MACSVLCLLCGDCYAADADDETIMKELDSLHWIDAVMQVLSLLQPQRPWRGSSV
jgi:hypothetical protein